MMWKVPKVLIGLGVVILALVFVLGRENLWSGVSSSASSVRPDQSPEERVSPGKAIGKAASRSCCCGGARVEDIEAVSVNDKVKRLVYEEYAKKLNDTSITVEVNDLGCHLEARVLKDGKPLKHLSVSEGRIQEID
jgi:hypothetical protein